MENKTFHTEQGFIVDSQELARLAPQADAQTADVLIEAAVRELT